MKDFVQLISVYFPQIATFITEVIFVVFLILNISEDFDKIAGFVNKIFDVRKHIDSLIYAKKRKNYNKTLYQSEYLNWQKAVLDKIYGELIEEKNKEFRKLYAQDDFIPQIKFSEIVFNDIKRHSYEAITLKLLPVDFPFRGICSKKELLRKKDITEEQYPGIIATHKKQVSRYYRLIKETIRYPKRMGYMLDEIVLGKANMEQPWKITAYVGNYENNLKTSHILEYELYQLYRCDKVLKWNVKDKTKEEILGKLPIRNYIHERFKKEGCRESDVLTSGKFRSSLLGVQMFVLVKNYSGSYDALRIRRSLNVAAKPGFLQFIPSGGFEAMNDCTDFDSQWDNYSLVKAIFRELLEECFGQDEDDKKATGNNVSPDRIYSNEHIRDLMRMLENSQKAQMQLLGTSMSLVGLRQELSFILRVDDPLFASMLIGNYESKSAVHLIDIRTLEDSDFWTDDDFEKLNCTSAGLFELARESEIYKKCLSEAMKSEKNQPVRNME